MEYSYGTDMRSRRLLILLMLAAWVLLGPVAMAFDDCPGMMSMCEGPCGALPYLQYAPPSITAPVAVATITALSPRSLPAVVPTALDPPPKSVSA